MKHYCPSRRPVESVQRHVSEYWCNMRAESHGCPCFSKKPAEFIHHVPGITEYWLYLGWILWEESSERVMAVRAFGAFGVLLLLILVLLADRVKESAEDG